MLSLTATNFFSTEDTIKDYLFKKIRTKKDIIGGLNEIYEDEPFKSFCYIREFGSGGAAVLGNKAGGSNFGGKRKRLKLAAESA